MNSLFKVNYILMLLMPLLLITGPFLSDLVVVLFFCCSVILYFKNYIVIKKNLLNFIYFFLIFYFIAVLSSSLSIEKFISLKSSITYLRYLGFVLIAYFLYSIKNDLIEKLGLVVILIFLLFFLDSILYFLFGFNIPFEKMSNDRFSSFFGDEKILGSYVARLSPLGFIFISLIGDKKYKKIIFYSYTLLISYLILLSGERTALVFLLIELTIIIIFFKSFRKMLLTFFLISLVLIISLIYFSPNTKFVKPVERIIMHSMKQIYFNNEEFSFFSQRHEDHFSTAIKIFKKNILLGTGNKSFRYLCSMDDYSVESNVTKRYTTFSKYDDYIIFLKDRRVRANDFQDLFIIYYKNNNKVHTNKVFDITKFKEFFDRPLYKFEIEYFDKNTISNKNFEKLNNTYVKKNQKLFVSDGKIYFTNGCNTHPHHIYLQVASENGIINLAIIISLFFYIIFKFIDIYKKKYETHLKDKKILLLSMIFIQILPFIPSGNFYNNWLSIFFFLPIGFYLALLDFKK